MSEEAKAKLPTSLWHYTTAEGVKGIIESESIHCTNIFYLNDREEFRHGIDLQLDQLTQLCAAGISQELQGHISQLQDYLRDASRRPDIAAAYTFSLSDAADQLAQWRAYGGGEGGFAIEFDGNVLNAVAQRHQATVLPCFYDNANRGAMLRKIDALFAEIVNNSKHELEVAKLGRFGEASVRLLQVAQVHASVFKHPYFSEERELRLLRRINDDGSDLVQYRVKGSTLVPYVTVHLRAKDVNEASSISRVMVGPARHKDLNVRAIEGLLKTRGLHKKVEVLSSDSPFRAL